MVDLVGRAVGARDVHRLDETGADADGFLRIDGDIAFAVRTDAFLGHRQAVLRGSSGGIVRRKRHVVHARIARFLEVGIVRFEQGDSGFADAEEWNVSSFQRHIAALKPKRIAEEPAGRIDIAGGEGEVVHCIAGHD